MRTTIESNFVAIRDTLSASATVSKIKYSQRDLLDFLYTLDQINVLNEDTGSFNGEPLSEWQIDKAFKGFLYPVKVGVAVSERASINLITSKKFAVPTITWIEKVDEVDAKGEKISKDIKKSYKAKTLTKSQFMDVQSAIAASFRRAPEFERVTTCREKAWDLSEHWSQVIDRNGLCCSDGSDMDVVPVNVSIDMSELVRDYKLVFTEETVRSNFLARWRASVLSK